MSLLQAIQLLFVLLAAGMVWGSFGGGWYGPYPQTGLPIRSLVGLALSLVVLYIVYILVVHIVVHA